MGVLQNAMKRMWRLFCPESGEKYHRPMHLHRGSQRHVSSLHELLLDRGNRWSVLHGFWEEQREPELPGTRKRNRSRSGDGGSATLPTHRTLSKHSFGISSAFFNEFSYPKPPLVPLPCPLLDGWPPPTRTTQSSSWCSQCVARPQRPMGRKSSPRSKEARQFSV